MLELHFNRKTPNVRRGTGGIWGRGSEEAQRFLDETMRAWRKHAFLKFWYALQTQSKRGVPTRSIATPKPTWETSPFLGPTNPPNEVGTKKLFLVLLISHLQCSHQQDASITWCDFLILRPGKAPENYPIVWCLAAFWKSTLASSDVIVSSQICGLKLKRCFHMQWWMGAASHPKFSLRLLFRYTSSFCTVN